MITTCRDLIIVEDDCETTDGILLPSNRAVGRYTPSGDLITATSDTRPVLVRSPITCKSHGGICRFCYGNDPATRSLVRLGAAAGAVAAHSLTESTTQMTMRTFHTSGAATIKDSPMVIKAQKSGTVDIYNHGWYKVIRIGDLQYFVETKYAKILVEEWDEVEAGQPIAIYETGLQNDDVSGSLPRIEALYESRIPSHGVASLMSHTDGVVEIEPVETQMDGWVKQEFRVSVDGKFRGKVSGVPIFYAHRSVANLGDKLTFGQVHMSQFFEDTRKDLKATFSVFMRELDSIYQSEGMVPMPVHYEVIYRAMTEIVDVSDGVKGLKRYGDVGIERMRGIEQVGKDYPSWMKAAMRCYVKTRLGNNVNLRSIKGREDE